MYNLGCRVASEFRWYCHSWLCGSCSCCVLLKSSENSWTPGDSGCSFLCSHSKRTTAQPYLRWCLVCLYGIWHMALLSQLPNNKNLLFHELGYWSIMVFDTTCTVEDTRRAHRSSCSESGLILAGEVGRKVWADQAARSWLEKKPIVSASLVAVESLPPWTIGERILKHFLSWFWVRKGHLCTDGRRHTVPPLWKRAQPHWDLLRILCSSPPAPFLVLFQRLVVCRRRSHMRTNQSIGK